MKLLWPAEIVLKFTYCNNIASDLLVFVVLFAKQKNNYTIGPLLANDQGEIFLRELDLRSHIEKQQSDFPMDYDGGLGDCFGFEVIVEDAKELCQRVTRLREFYSDEADKLARQVRKCSNANVVSFKEKWSIPLANTQIEIDLMSTGGLNDLGDVPS